MKDEVVLYFSRLKRGQQNNFKGNQKVKIVLDRIKNIWYPIKVAARETKTPKRTLITEQRNTSRLENSLQFRKTEQTKTVM